MYLDQWFPTSFFLYTSQYKSTSSCNPSSQVAIVLAWTVSLEYVFRHPGWEINKQIPPDKQEKEQRKFTSEEKIFYFWRIPTFYVNTIVCLLYSKQYACVCVCVLVLLLTVWGDCLYGLALASDVPYGQSSI